MTVLLHQKTKTRKFSTSDKEIKQLRQKITKKKGEKMKMNYNECVNEVMRECVNQTDTLTNTRDNTLFKNVLAIILTK